MKLLRILLGLVATAGVASAAQLTAGLPLIAIGPTNITTTNAAGFRAAIGALAIADAPPPAVVGNTIHVEEHGDDGTGTGSVDFPFRSLTAAFVAKVAGDEILMGPGTFDFTVTAAAGSTAEANRLVSYFAVKGAGKGVTFVNVIPRGTNEHNRVLSVPASTPVTNVLFSGFTLDGNDSDYAWDTGGKLDWILQGQNITVENVEVIDWGGDAALEAFTPLFQSSTNYVVRNSLFRLPGSANVTGPTAEDSSRGLFEGNVVEGYNVAFGMAGMSSWNVITGNRMTNITTAGFIYDTAGSGEIWGNTISRNRFSSAGDGVLIGLGAHLDLRIFGNEFFGSNRGINLTNYNGSATNYFLRPVVTENTFYISSGRNIYGTGVTNGAFFLNIGRSTSDNSVNGSSNFGAFNMDRTGTLYANIPNTLQGAGGGITITATGFDGNLATTDDTLQEVAQKVDDLVLGSGSVDDTAYDATSWNGVTTVAPSKNAVRDKIESMSAGSGDDVWVNGSNVTHPDFDNTASSGTVTPTTFSVSGTNVTLTIGNAGATAAGAVTTGTQTFAGDKTFTGSLTVEGALNLSGSGGSGLDSINVTNKLTNGVLTATRVVFAGADKALADDADLTFATDTLNATKLTSTDVRAGLGVFTNTVTIPNSDDPDVSAAGHIAWDTDGWLRAYDGANQVAVGRKIEEIHATIVAPNDLADAVRDAALIWSNESGMSFVVTGWKGWSGTDDTTLNIEETDGDGANNATVDAVEIATNGTGVFYGSDTTITAATIENGHLLWLDFDDTDTPTYVKVTIYGYYDANVN